MCASRRHLLGAAALVCISASTARAHAWTETTVKSDVITVDVDGDGKAIVSHELLMKVRGSRVSNIELDGVSSDALPLPDALVSPATSGALGQSSLPLLLNRGDDGVLRIEIDDKRGLGAGTFLFKFAYRTDLFFERKITLRGPWAEVRFVGPRFPDGLDSARLVFRVPHGNPAPELPDFRAEGAAPGDEIDDTFLSNLRRMGDRDELDVIRPHVAKGEPVLWRAWVSPKLFKAFAHSSEALPPKIAPAPAAVNLESQSRIWALLLMSGLVYASLVFVKARRFARACTERSATPRPIVALPPALRALLAGALFAAFGLLSVRSEPTLASLLLISSMAVATELGPRVKSGLRGPGRWLVLRDEEAFVRSSPRAAELWLDCGSLRGFALLGVLFALYGVLALELLPVSPYYSGVVALGAAALLPIFCTGRSSQLPSQPTPAAQKLLAFIAEQVRKRDGLKVVAWARIPDGGAAIDELRLLIVPRQPKAGLSSIEVGVEQHEGSAPHLAVPYVMVRARDGSASHRALPRACSWMRGRKRDERVAILRPKLPTRALCLALLRRVVQELEMPHDEAQSASSRFRISARSGSSTLKPGSTLSPSHAR